MVPHGSGHKMKQETFRLLGEGMFSPVYGEDGKVLEHAAQRAWAVPTLEGFQH